MLRLLPQLVHGDSCFKCYSCFSRTEWHVSALLLPFTTLVLFCRSPKKALSAHRHNVLLLCLRDGLITHYRHLLAWHACLSIFNCFCLVTGSEIFTDRILDRILAQTEWKKHLKFICTWVDFASVDISSASHLLLFEDSLSNNCIFPHSCTKPQQRNVCSFLSPISVPLVLIDWRLGVVRISDWRKPL